MQVIRGKKGRKCELQEHPASGKERKVLHQST